MRGLNKKMTNITKLIWRLKEQPTTESLRELVKDKILSNEEARQILFSQEREEEVGKKSLEQEIKFLREIVDKLSQSRDRTIEIVKEVYRPYSQQPWSQPYFTWCNPGQYANAGTISFDTSGNNQLNAGMLTVNSNFSDIKTF